MKVQYAVHHEGMFAQERWTPQSLQCGMSPCPPEIRKPSQPFPHVKRKCIRANQEVKVTTTEHTNWILSLSWIPFQMVNLHRLANPLLYLVLTAICIYLTVEVCFKCKIYYAKKSYMWKRLQLKQDIFRFLERETSTKVIWRIKSQKLTKKKPSLSKASTKGV